MRYIQIDEAEVGMIIAKPVFDSNERVLLGVNSILTQEYLNSLIRRGMPGIYIKDEWSKDIEIDDVISVELRNEGVEALKHNDIDKTLGVAKKIIDQILSSSVISLDMMDLKSYDNYTYQHSVNVAVVSSLVGMKMGLNRDALEELCMAAILHDIGKTLVPPEIINKPDRLTKEEYEQVQKHSEYGYEVVKDRMDISAKVKAAILTHHENEDGTGYPKHYKGNQIHIYAKIIHVADVFDALTSKRPYKTSYARYEAAEYLMGGCDRMFNHEIVVAFMSAVPIYPRGLCVHLSDDREAIVTKNTKNLLRPIVRFENNEELDLSDLSKNRNLTIVPKEKADVR